MAEEYPYNQPEFPGSRSSENPTLERLGPSAEQRAEQEKWASRPYMTAAQFYYLYPIEKEIADGRSR